MVNEKMETSERNTTEESDGQIKYNESVKELMREKMNLDPVLYPNASRLLEEEIIRAQKGKSYRDSRTPVDLYRERPIRAVVKVQVPVKDHPRFNFVGKLLGPKGNSLKRLQEETMTKMAILGRGSMRDKQKEEECRASLDPKYSHLSDELHLEIATLAAPAEAHARLAYALAEVRKYLVPDANDEIRMEQLREIEAEGGIRPRNQYQQRSILSRTTTFRRTPTNPNQILTHPHPPPPQPVPPQPIQPVHQFVPPQPRVTTGNSKVMSILDKARIAIEENYTTPQQYQPQQNYVYENNEVQNDYYDQGYTDPHGSGRWKGYKGGGVGGGGFTSRYPSNRPSPYSRPMK